MPLPPGQTHRDYPDDIVDKALELAASIGFRAAGERMGIPFQTIHGWSKMAAHAERWSELRRNHAPAWRARAAIPLEDLVDEYGELQAKALRKAAQAVDNGDIEAKDIGNFLRSIAWAQSSAADQANRLRGHASHVVEHRVSAGQLEAAMTALLEEAQTVDSTAVELPPGPELPEGD